MLKYAVLDDDSKVINIVIAPSEEIAQSVTSSKCVFIDTLECDINFTWDGSKFIDPNAPAPVEEPAPAE